METTVGTLAVPQVSMSAFILAYDWDMTTVWARMKGEGREAGISGAFPVSV
jgi:hypothetical protein